jgi:SAM-dependent methyltransferase
MPRVFSPRLVLGLDLVESNIAICKRHRSRDCEHYIVGNATELPLAAMSLDVVVNIESSHSYGSFERFAKEVYRVLRPSGALLFGDLRPSGEAWNATFRVFRDVGFSVLRAEDVSDGVLRAIESKDSRSASALRGHRFDDASLATVSEAMLFFRSTACERMKNDDARFMTAKLVKAPSP